MNKRKSNGCITCKLRKKKCDEIKPICGDCSRLGRRCEYINENMTNDEINKLTHEMSIIENNSKSRNRKRKRNEFESYDNNNNNNNIYNNNNNNNYNNNNNNNNNNELTIIANPSILQNTTLANLSPIDKFLYNYYRDKLSFIVCSAPKNENMYLNTFLPMAHVDKSVLYSILAWSAFHLGGKEWLKWGKYYINQSFKRFKNNPILIEEISEFDEIGDDNDDNKEIYENNSNNNNNNNNSSIIDKDDFTYSLNYENLINTRLAAFLILCGVEICKGDVYNWSKYLKLSYELINLRGGLDKFNNSKVEHFLITNFAYHDIIGINKNISYFDIKDYEKMWLVSNKIKFIDPLHGISSPVFQLLAQINNLIENINRENDIDDDDNNDKIMNYYEIFNECQKIEIMINNVKPRLPIDLNLNEKELELQLTIFECFQITLKIYLKTLILKINSSSIEIQYLNNKLIKLLDILLGSEFESCLCLPIFIAGLNCINFNDRIEINNKIQLFINRYKWKNVLICQLIINYVWKLNFNGDKFINWYLIIKKLGWNLSFA